MLVSGREVLGWAAERGCAAGSFNTYNLEITRAIIAAAESAQSPIFLAAGEGALRNGGRGLIALMLAEADAARVPVAVHLDHGSSPERAGELVGAGFTSVMVDGSALSLDANIELLRRSRQAVGDTALEAELGGVGGREDASGDQTTAIPMSDPDHCSRLVGETGVDSLAVAIGNAHGTYRGEPQLDLDRLDTIRAAVEVPLVLHGASGLPADLITECIRRGVRKINVNTEIRRALFRTTAEALQSDGGALDLPGLHARTVEAMAAVVVHHITLFRDGS